jgi:hypothetical protein
MSYVPWKGPAQTVRIGQPRLRRRRGGPASHGASIHVCSLLARKRLKPSMVPRLSRTQARGFMESIIKW